MTPKARNILLVCGILVVVGIGAIGFAVYSVYSILTNIGMDRQVPDEIREARITKGSEFLSRSKFFELESGGLLKAIGEGATKEDEKEREKVINARVGRSIYNIADMLVTGSDVIAAAEFGGFVFDHNGNLKKEILFEPITEKVKIGPFEQNSYRPGLDNLRIVRLDANRIGFLAFGSIQGVRIFDEIGNEIWAHGKKDLDLVGALKDSDTEYEKSSHVLEAAVGDLDGDGVSEYVVARKKDGIRAYDRTGKELWFQPDDFPSAELEIVDLDNDGKGELIEIGERVRAGDGKLVREMKGSDNDAFLVIENGSGESEVQFAKIYDGKLTYMNEKGEKIFSAEAPLSEVKRSPSMSDGAGKKPKAEGEKVFAAEASLSGVEASPSLVEVWGAPSDSESVAFPKALWVMLRSNEPKYLVVLASFISLPRSNLYVYDMNGALVYHELLPEQAETLAILPVADGIEHILVGGKDTIWRYAPRQGR